MQRIRLILTGALMLLLFAGIPVAFGQGTGGAQGAPATQSFTLQPGARANVAFEAFCLDFGKIFPQAIQPPTSVAANNVRAALNYAQTNNLTTNEQQALQVQYAIWQLRGATGSPQGSQVAQDVVTNAQAALTAQQGTSVVEAAQAGQVRLTVDSWQPIGSKVEITPGATDNFYGRGQMTIENVSQQALTLHIPVGMVFPPADATAQTMAGYATNIQSGSAQATTSPTTQATTSPTATTQATVAPTATTQATIAPTATTQATIAPTATTQATIAPTATTTTGQAGGGQQTPGQSPSQLPATGENDSSPLLLIAAISLALLAGGIFVRAARRG